MPCVSICANLSFSRPIFAWMSVEPERPKEMHSYRMIALILVLSAAMIGPAGAASLTNDDRNEIVEKILSSYASLSFDKNYEGAREQCKEARAFAATFDPDDWAQGHIDGCFAKIAEGQNDRAGVCELRDSQIVHYERVMATGPEDLRQSGVAGGIVSAKKSRATFHCE